MSSVLEKNDVDINPLFAWSKEFEIVTSDGTYPVFMRVCGDADIGKARVSALRKSAELRKNLKDLNSDERFAYIKEMDELSVESMVSVVIVFSMRDLSEKAKKQVKIKAPKQPRSDASTEAHEKYQKEVDDYPTKYQQAIKKFLEKEVEIMKAKLESLDKETLYTKYVSFMIDELCERDLMKYFREWTAYLSSYKDEGLKTRFFESFDDFANLPSDLKEEFIKQYTLLELSMDNLKKLQPVTQ